MEGIGYLLTKLPIQKREERWRNQIENLKKERKVLVSGDPNEKKSNRVDIIDKQLARLEQLCRNAA